MLEPDVSDNFSDGVIGRSVETLIDRLSHLAPELLVLVFQQISIFERGRLGQTSKGLAAIAASDEAWSDAWAELEDAPARSDPRAALRAAWTLDSVKWAALPSAGGQPPPMWRQHFSAVSSGRYVILHGGEGSESMRTCAFDLIDACWHDVAEAPDRFAITMPFPRRFNADAGGGRVLRRGSERWACFFGGHREEGPRDNETWLLGPLTLRPADWRWVEAHADPNGRAQSPG